MYPLTRRLLPRASQLIARPCYAAPATHFHTTPHTSATPDAMPDSLASKSFKGKTGGGEPLNSTSAGAPPEPKISNLSVPQKDGDEPPTEKMTEEQRKEVEEHNREFERTHEKKGSHENLEGKEEKGSEMEKGKKGNGEQAGKGEEEAEASEDRMKGQPKDAKGGYEY